MRALITGGAGFIGSHVAERLLDHGCAVVCLDDFSDSYDPDIKRSNLAACLNHPRFKLVRGDIRDKALVGSLFAGTAFDKVVHLAARAGVRQSLKDPLLYEDVNVRGTLNLLETSKNARVERFLFASSSSVYGVNGNTPFRETHPVDCPISPYAATKVAGEHLCYTYHHLYGLPCACLRLFTVYGPRQRPDMAIHQFIRRIDQCREITMFGDGTSRRDYTYISDIVDGIAAALEGDFEFEVFNLGSSHPTALCQLVSVIGQTLGRKPIIRKLPDQPGDVPTTLADIGKAQQCLGYNPRVQIEEGIQRAVDWYQRTKN